MQDHRSRDPRSDTTPLAISLCPAGRVIVVTGTGFWASEDVDEHFRRLEGEIRKARVRAGIVRVLVDHAETQVQSAAILDRIRGRIEQLYRKGDRVAILVATSLLAMQVRRVGGRFDRRQFSDRDEAMAWLLSSDQPVSPDLTSADHAPS